jgi:hypothetical protein
MHRALRQPWRLTVVALFAALALAGCSGTPQAVVGVPGSYTFGRELVGLQQGVAGGTIAVCVDHRESIVIQAGPWSPNYYSLTWDGVTYVEGGGTGSIYPLTTPPLGPGCGTLTVRAFTYHVEVPDSITVRLSEAPT